MHSWEQLGKLMQSCYLGIWHWALSCYRPNSSGSWEGTRGVSEGEKEPRTTSWNLSSFHCLQAYWHRWPEETGTFWYGAALGPDWEQLREVIWPELDRCTNKVSWHISDTRSFTGPVAVYLCLPSSCACLLWVTNQTHTGRKFREAHF